jgi:hypothetical protein
LGERQPCRDVGSLPSPLYRLPGADSVDPPNRRRVGLRVCGVAPYRAPQPRRSGLPEPKVRHPVLGLPTAHDKTKLGSHRLQDACPLAGPGLPEQPRASVPGSIAALEKPAPCPERQLDTSKPAGSSAVSLGLSKSKARPMRSVSSMGGHTRKTCPDSSLHAGGSPASSLSSSGSSLQVLAAPLKGTFKVGLVWAGSRRHVDDDQPDTRGLCPPRRARQARPGAQGLGRTPRIPRDPAPGGALARARIWRTSPPVSPNNEKRCAPHRGTCVPGQPSCCTGGATGGELCGPGAAYRSSNAS